MEKLMEKSCRFEYIFRKLSLYGKVTVSELSRELKVSEVTLRKDIDEMDAKGLLTRVRGGAVNLKQKSKPDSVFSRVPDGDNMELKHKVAKAASKLISSGDSLIVTSGVTPHLTLLYASECSNLKIVSDSLYIAADICRRPDYQTIILGGELSVSDYFIHGRDAVRQAGKYMADKAILTMDGVDAKAGLTTTRVEGADTLKSILARARMRIIVADITKIGLEKFCNIGTISVMDVLVTNRTDAPDKLDNLHRIERSGVQVIFAE